MNIQIDDAVITKIEKTLLQGDKLGYINFEVEGDQVVLRIHFRERYVDGTMSAPNYNSYTLKER